MNYTIITETSIDVTCLEDLPKLRILMEANNMKPNYAKIARDLNIKDYRTVKRYYNGDTPDKTTRNRTSELDEIKPLVLKLLSAEMPNIFHYKKNLYDYLVDKKMTDVKSSTFRTWIIKNDDLNTAFKNQFKVKRSKENNSSNNGQTRNEQSPGHQMQLDWKEDLCLLLKDGTELKFNIGMLVLSFSRFKYAFFTLDKKQDVLLDFIVCSLEAYGGVVNQIVCDNMKTVMDKARTEYFKGIKNSRIIEFEKDFGVSFKPCKARQPFSKGKVEAPMKIFDAIYAYNGELTFSEAVAKIEEIVHKANTSINQGTNSVPIMDLVLDKEKAPLPLPRETVRNSYKIIFGQALVNSTNMFSYKSCQYSVPAGLTRKFIQFRVIDNRLHVYYNNKSIALHEITTQKINYAPEHRELADAYNKNWNDEYKLEEHEQYASITPKLPSNLEQLGVQYGS